MQYKQDLAKIRSLMERVGSNMTPYQAYLNEEKWINEVYDMKKDDYVSPNDFFDMMEKIGDAKFVTIGYVTGVKLNATIKKKNPLTNRMKNYPDYSPFNQEGQDEVAGLIKLTSWNMQFRKREAVYGMYSAQKERINQIKDRYGLPLIQDIEGYKGQNGYGDNTEKYTGNNTKLSAHQYTPFNAARANKKAEYYAINQEGRIIRKLEKKEVVPYIKEKTDPNASAIKKLAEMGKNEEEINRYVEEIAAEQRNFKYQNFEANSILYIAATIDGRKKAYINDNFSRYVNGVMVNAQDLTAIARQRYKQDVAQLPQA